MSAVKPSPTHVWLAIEIYLKHAYQDAPPSAVRARLETLRALSPEDFYDSSVFEHDPAPERGKWSLRLGNRFYPHMKLAIERQPDKHGYLFHADTHDRHACPAPGSRDFIAFKQLMEMNQTLAQAIETAWSTAELPTFKTYLRHDLERRAAKDPLNPRT